MRPTIVILTLALVALLIAPIASAQPAEPTDLPGPRTADASARDLVLQVAEAMDERADVSSTLEYYRLEPGQAVALLNVPPGRSGHVALLFLAIQSYDPRGLLDSRLRVYLNGEVQPSTDTAIGPFFAATFGSPRWASRLMGVSTMNLSTPPYHAGFYRYLTIPYTQGARITLENGSPEQSLTLWSQVYYHDGPAPRDQSGLFATASLEEQKVTPYQVVELANVEGSGTLHGLSLAVDGDNWSFQEGNLVVYVDGAPALVSSGTEDFFLGSFYYDQGPFQTDAVGMTVKDDERFAGTFYRLFLDDPVVFRHSLRVAWQNGQEGQGTNPGTVRLWSNVWYYRGGLPGPARVNIPARPEGGWDPALDPHYAGGAEGLGITFSNGGALDRYVRGTVPLPGDWQPGTEVTVKALLYSPAVTQTVQAQTYLAARRQGGPARAWDWSNRKREASSTAVLTPDTLTELTLGTLPAHLIEPSDHLAVAFTLRRSFNPDLPLDGEVVVQDVWVEYVPAWKGAGQAAAVTAGQSASASPASEATQETVPAMSTPPP